MFSDPNPNKFRNKKRGKPHVYTPLETCSRPPLCDYFLRKRKSCERKDLPDLIAILPVEIVNIQYATICHKMRHWPGRLS